MTAEGTGINLRMNIKGATGLNRFKAYISLAIVLAVAMMSTSWFYVRSVPTGAPPDELAHLGYVADVATGHHLIPDYRHSEILESRQPNYLNHPPLYYSAEGLVGRILHWDPIINVARYRALSTLWVALGIFLWVLICGRLGLGLLHTIAAVGACMAIPMFTYLAGAVNNDDMCYLGIALFFYGFVLFQHRQRVSAYVMALGLVVTMLTKATGSLFLLTFLISWGALSWPQLRTALLNIHIRISVAAVALICCAYYLPTLVIYHTPFPHPGNLLRPPMPADPAMSFIRYTRIFIETMFSYLPLILSHKSFEPVTGALKVAFYLMLALPLLAWLGWRVGAKASWRRVMADAYMIALLVTVAANLWVSWQGYWQVGQFTGVQPRYFAFALPGLFVMGFMENYRFKIRNTILLIFATIAAFLALHKPSLSAIEHMRGDQQRFTELHWSSVEENSSIPFTKLTSGISTQIAGNLDKVAIKEHEARLQGWAIDVSSKQPARDVMVSVHGHLLGTIHPGSSRPDVVQVLDSPNARYAGFTAMIDGLPDNVKPCDITVQALQDDGSLAPISNINCAP